MEHWEDWPDHELETPRLPRSPSSSVVSEIPIPVEHWEEWPDHGLETARPPRSPTPVAPNTRSSSPSLVSEVPIHAESPHPSPSPPHPNTDMIPDPGISWRAPQADQFLAQHAQTPWQDPEASLQEREASWQEVAWLLNAGLMPPAPLPLTPQEGFALSPRTSLWYDVDVVQNASSGYCAGCGEYFVAGQVALGYTANGRQQWVHAPRCVSSASLTAFPNSRTLIRFNPHMPPWERNPIIEVVAQAIGGTIRTELNEAGTPEFSEILVPPTPRSIPEYQTGHLLVRPSSVPIWPSSVPITPFPPTPRVIPAHRTPSMAYHQMYGFRTPGAHPVPARVLTPDPLGLWAPPWTPTTTPPRPLMRWDRHNAFPGALGQSRTWLFHPSTAWPPPADDGDDGGAGVQQHDGPTLQAMLQFLPVQRLEQKEAEPCVVCQEPMIEGEEVRRLPCCHVFHLACIDRWLGIKATCPLDNMALQDMLDKQEDPLNDQ